MQRRVLDKHARPEQAELLRRAKAGVRLDNLAKASKRLGPLGTAGGTSYIGNSSTAIASLRAKATMEVALETISKAQREKAAEKKRMSKEVLKRRAQERREKLQLEAPIAAALQQRLPEEYQAGSAITLKLLKSLCAVLGVKVAGTRDAIVVAVLQHLLTLGGEAPSLAPVSEAANGAAASDLNS